MCYLVECLSFILMDLLFGHSFFDKGRNIPRQDFDKVMDDQHLEHPELVNFGFYLVE